MNVGVSIKKVIALARIMLVDGLRRHALIGLLVLALAAEAGGLLFFDFIHRDIGRASTDFIFSVSWVVGFIFLFFHAVQVMAWDEERRVIHTLLAPPLSRGEYVVGVFVGLGGLLLLLNIILGAIGWGTLMVIRQMVDSGYFSYFSDGFYLISWLGLFAMQLMMLAVILLFSGLVRGGFPVLLVSLCFYMICSGLPVVRESMAQRMQEVPGLETTSRVLKGMNAIFPDFSRLDFKNAVVSSAGIPELSMLATNFGLFLLYTIVLLWMASAVYQRRDLQ
jgi:Cu-processing system permease protein